jgi:hypothetical protein
MALGKSYTVTGGHPGITPIYFNSSGNAQQTIVGGYLVNVKSTANAGTFAATETPDTFAAVAVTSSVGTLAATEAADVFAAVGSVGYVGVLATTEIADTFAAVGNVPTNGTLAATEAADIFAATGAQAIGAVWASTETADHSYITGYTVDTGTFDVTEHSDGWSTSSGFDRLGIDTFAFQNNGASSSVVDFYTTGPNRIIVFNLAVGAYNGSPGFITGITDDFGLTWHAEAFVGGGPDTNGDYQIIHTWWAYAKNIVPFHGNAGSNFKMTISYSAGALPNLQTAWFSVKGLNGNFNYPWGSRDNPFALGSGIGAWFPPPDTQPQTLIPIATGPLGLSTGTTSFVYSSHVALGSGNLAVLSDATGTSANTYGLPALTDAKTSGRFYFEVTWNHIAGSAYATAIGLVTDSVGAVGGRVRGDGAILVQSTQVGTLGVVPADNDVIAVAVNVDAGTVWFKNITQSGDWNGIINADPTYNVLGFDYKASNPFFQANNYTLPIALPDHISSSALQTYNFGATTYAGTKPDGFQNWGHIADPVGRVPYPSMIIAWDLSTTNSLFGVIDTAPLFTQLGAFGQVGSQRNTSFGIQYSIRAESILFADDERVVNNTAAPTWIKMTDALVVGSMQPGDLNATEITDGFHAVGYPGAFGFTGFFTPTEATDHFAAVGIVATVGRLASTEAPDVFSAYGFQPLTMVWTSTEAPDRFAGTGIGQGEDGTWTSTEAADIFAATGTVPISGSFDTTDNADRFRAIGAGVTQVNRRRPFIVT